MIIIKNKRQQKAIRNFGINIKDNGLQIVKINSSYKNYFANIFEKIKELGSVLFVFICSPFVIIACLFRILLSLRIWTLIYIKKNLNNEEIIVKSTFKEDMK